MSCFGKRLGKRLTRILRIFRTDILITSVQNIFVHEGRTGRDLSEEANLDRLANLDPFALLDENLAGVLAAIAAIQTGNPVLLRVIAFLERLQRGHEVVSTRDTVRNHTFRDTGCHGALDDGGYRVHRPNHLCLVLGRHMELDLLEQILRCTETTHDEDVLSTVLVGFEQDPKNK